MGLADTLPDKLSKLIELALDDLEQVEKMPETYTVNMDAWHEPGTNGRCTVCLAGAVMAVSLGMSDNLDFYSFRRVNFIDDETCQKLNAIDYARRGSFESAVNLLAGKFSFVLYADPVEIAVPRYGDDPADFKRALRTAVTKLEKHGL